MSNGWVKTIERLEKDLTEAYEKILENSSCGCCKHEHKMGKDHDEDCIIKKAEEWMEG
jgi:hypothetical protein